MATMMMNAEVARYVARRTPQGDGERRLVATALEALARAERSVRAVELEIQRRLTNEELLIVQDAIAAA